MQTEMNTIKVALVDDHSLLRSALATVINKSANCTVIAEAVNGAEMISKIEAGANPDVILLDLNMPNMDGYDTAKWLNVNRPEIHVLMLTMYDTEPAMIRLLQAGVKGFLRKDTDLGEVRTAINTVMHSGYCYTNHTTGRLINMIRKSDEHSSLLKTALTDTEVRFLKWACTDLTYKEISTQMGLNLRSIDNMRDNLFDKLNVRNRVGMAMFAIKNGIHPI